MASNSTRSGWDKGIPRFQHDAGHDRDSAATGVRATLTSFVALRTANFSV
jgi:hypothetical protein